MVKTSPPNPLRIRGFTLIELIIVIVVIGILAAVATFNASPPELTIPSQAETMASNIRYLQTTANAGKRTWLTVTTGPSGSYVGNMCNDNCSASTELFSVSSENLKGLSLTGSPTTIYFDTLGRPTTGATGYAATSAYYDIGGQKRVNVAESSGHVTVKVTPPVTPP